VVAEQAAVRQQAQADARIRNQIEGKCGQGKRRFTLVRVMAKLASTAETAIAITCLVINLERRLQALLFVLFPLLFSLCQFSIKGRHRQPSQVSRVWKPT
jgi:membrane glycosyltransferase